MNVSPSNHETERTGPRHRRGLRGQTRGRPLPRARLRERCRAVSVWGIAAWSLLLIGCADGEKDRQVAKAVVSSGKEAPEKGRRKVMPKRPPIRRHSVRDPMRGIQGATEEIRRRALAGVSVVSPTRVIRHQLKQVEWNRYPKNFKPFYDALDSRAARLATSKDVPKDFNELVNGCIACHHVFAKDYISVVTWLPLSSAEQAAARQRAASLRVARPETSESGGGPPSPASTRSQGKVEIIQAAPPDP